jgi:hypothetical protein
MAHADAPEGRYTLETEAVVHDARTGLSWQRHMDTTQRTVADANRYCAALDLAGSGWRLPTRAELLTLVDPTRNNPAIDPNAFPNTASAAFWSSTSYAGENGKAWYVRFASGDSRSQPVDSLYLVRCVR